VHFHIRERNKRKRSAKQKNRRRNSLPFSRDKIGKKRFVNNFKLFEKIGKKK
jgi:hypothetical protein